MALKRVRFAVPEQPCEHRSRAKAPSRAQSTAARLRRMSDELQQELRACLERNAQLQGACTSLELKLRSAQEEVKHLRQQLRQQVDEGSRKRDRDSMEAADAAGGKVADLARQLAVCNEEKRQLKRQLQEAERRLSGGDSHAVASQPQQQQLLLARWWSCTMAGQWQPRLRSRGASPRPALADSSVWDR